MWYAAGRNFSGGFHRSLMRSDDLVTWERIEVGPGTVFEEIRRIQTVGDRVFLLGEQGFVSTSSDGDAFTCVQVAPSGVPIRTLGFDDVTPAPATTFLDNFGDFLYTTDGLSYTDTTDGLFFVPFLTYVPPSAGNPNGIWVSTGRNPSFGDTAAQWHDGDPNTLNWHAVTFAGGGFGIGRAACFDPDAGVAVIVGKGDTYTSTDGKTFTRTGASPFSTISESVLRHYGGLTLLGTNNGKIYTSTDNATWSADHLGGLVGTATIRDISYNGELFVATTNNFQLLSSPDGITWSLAYTWTDDEIWTITWFIPSLGHGFFRYPLYWDQINGEVGR